MPGPRNLQGIKIGEAITLTHLLFVDDVKLFTDGSKEEGRKLQKTSCIARLQV
jgi:hypothetical protein